MRFLFVIKSFAQVAGVERVMADKMNYLASSGHTIMLITYEQGNHPLVFDLIPDINHIDLNCRFFTLIKQSWPKRLFYSYIMRKRFLNKIKRIVETFKPNAIISPTYPLTVVGELISAKGNARIIFESHMTYIQALKEYNKQRSYIIKIIAKIYDLSTLRKLSKCDCLAVLTKGDCNFWKKYIQNTVVLPNPLTKFPDKINDVRKDNNRIISIGRLTHIKRFDRLIDAFALISEFNHNWHIDIYGEGSDKNKLIDKITKFDLNNRIKIHSPTNDIYTEMKKSQILVMTSESEGFPLVLIEAMACGIPCISFDCPYGPGEIIEHNKNGLLVKDGDIKDLANNIKYLMNNPNIVNSMGLNARISATQYQKDKIMKSWEQLYTEGANEKQ